MSSIYDSDTGDLVPLGGIRERGGPVGEGPAAGGAPVGEGLDGELEGEEGVEGVLQPHVGRPLRARLLGRVGEQLRHEDLGAGGVDEGVSLGRLTLWPARGADPRYGRRAARLGSRGADWQARSLPGADLEAGPSQQTGKPAG